MPIYLTSFPSEKASGTGRRAGRDGGQLISEIWLAEQADGIAVPVQPVREIPQGIAGGHGQEHQRSLVPAAGMLGCVLQRRVRGLDCLLRWFQVSPGHQVKP
jgi:hypothetical protein